ncbi:unnamed protein product [Spirodela intermedia]|uniref:Uncharacterized protein n=1 Tax=Spirodela intermedia TaxID=51605 RepID=A0A7I8KSB3_SPIIN|nr:unnamed protein product [Spirodela intermedia]
METMETGLAAVEERLDATKFAAPEAAGQSSVKLLEPKIFAGARNAKELENFLWDRDPYFRAINTPAAEKVKLPSMYLASDVKLWWCTRTEDPARPPIHSWEDFARELKEQFLPTNSAWIA